MATSARKAQPNPTPRRAGAGLWEILGVFALVGVLAYVAMGLDVKAMLPKPIPLVDHHFEGCNAARAMGMTNIPASHPSYREFMDGDGDGLACEPAPPN